MFLFQLFSLQKALIDSRPNNFGDCVEWARNYFEQQYANQIKQLLFNFPPDQMTASGQPFWSGPKRCPIPLVFDVNDPLHFDFVYAAANLMAQVYGIPPFHNRQAIVNLIQNIQVI